VVNSAPMNSLRTRRFSVAWILLALILFNGLACSFGHGQMLKAWVVGGSSSEGADASHSHHGMSGVDGRHGAMDASVQNHGMTHAMPHTKNPADTMDAHDPNMPMFEDCSFAATLILALVFFVGLGWLQRRRQLRISVPYAWHLTPLRHCCSGLNPHAP
jgi:hypothetical protein